MSARIVWSCDERECTKTKTVRGRMGGDGGFDEIQRWVPDSWFWCRVGKREYTLCPRHGREMDRRIRADNLKLCGDP